MSKGWRRRRHPHLGVSQLTEPKVCARSVLHRDLRAAEKAGGEDGKGLCPWLHSSGWHWSQWEHEASLCRSPGARLSFALAFYTFQSCREWKKRALNYWRKIRALLSSVATLKPFICQHCKVLEKSKADAEKAERHLGCGLSEKGL